MSDTFETATETATNAKDTFVDNSTTAYSSQYVFTSPATTTWAASRCITAGSLQTSPRQNTVKYLEQLDKQIANLESSIRSSVTDIKAQIDWVANAKVSLANLEKERNLIDLFVIDNP